MYTDCNLIKKETGMIVEKAAHVKYRMLIGDVTIYFDGYEDLGTLTLRIDGFLVGIVHEGSAKEFKTKMAELENEH